MNSRADDDQTFLQEVGFRIRELRTAKKLTQAQLADQCGLHRTFIGSVERGERNVSVLNLPPTYTGTCTAYPSRSDVEIEKPFDGYLAANLLLMEVTGAKVIRLPNGNQMVVAVASTVLKDKSAKDRLRAEKVCRVKALASVVAEKEGVQVAHTEQLKENTVVTLDNGKETGKNVSELLEITKTKVEGITKDMPVVGRWKSKDGDVFYLAIGVILDKKGEPILEKVP